MNRLTNFPLAWIRWLLLVLGIVLTVTPAFAQGQNLLSNPGFEQPFITLDGNPPRQVAQGWSPWHVSGGQSASENVQPEYYPATDSTNGLGVPRFRNGSDAQQYHTFFATHDGGLFQRVSGITRGAQLRFSTYIYVWSSTFDDPNLSEDPGGVVVQVGIDPTGGTDGSSSNIVWSAPSIQYDAYNEYSVTATASETAVTVFIRSTVSTPVKNNNIYVDDASLVVSSAGSATNTPVPATATATLTSTPLPPTATSTVGSVVATATNTSLPPTATTGVGASPSPTQDQVVSTATATLAPTSVIPPSATVLPATVTPTLSSGNTSVFPGRIVHIVQTGDAVVELAALYGSTIDAIIEANGLNSSALIRVGQALVIPVRLPPPATSTPTATPIAPVATATPGNVVTDPGANNIYIVQPGDTLSRIAARFNTTVATLAQLNGIANPNSIRYGQRLIISGANPAPAPTPVPPPVTTTYVVQPGDTLFRIAVRFNVSINQLAQANGISDPNRVFVGQVLVIP